jgi:hypothetical protein
MSLKHSLNVKIFSKKIKNIQNFVILKIKKNNKINQKTQVFTKILLKEFNLSTLLNTKIIKFPLNITFFSFLNPLISFCLNSDSFLFLLKLNNFIVLKINKNFLLRLKIFKKLVFLTFFYSYLKFFLLTKKF